MSDGRTWLLRTLRFRSVIRAEPGTSFTLRSGVKSDVYVDVRRTSLSSEPLRRLALELVRRARSAGISYTNVAGVVSGGCSLATAVSLLTGVDSLYVRPTPKDHGTGNQVEGNVIPGGTVVLFEDVVSTGGSTLVAVNALRAAGLNVAGVVAVLDREVGGIDRIRSVCPAEALFTLSELTGNDGA